MAGGMDLGVGSARGGKKPLDAAINLVPFIDLMACTIAFLIMTAVWTQIGRLPVQSSGTAVTTDAKPQELPELRLVITEKELRLSAGETNFAAIPITRDANSGLDVHSLAARLKDIKATTPDESQITLLADDPVRYDDLVRIVDTCVGAGLENVAVSPSAN